MRPFRARRDVGVFLGLKPQAESYYPFGISPTVPSGTERLPIHRFSKARCFCRQGADNRLGTGVDRVSSKELAERQIANLDTRKEAVTVQNLLDMTSGFGWEEPAYGKAPSVIEMVNSPDWIKFILDGLMSDMPGTRFQYDSGNAHLLSAILTKVTGISAAEYAKAKLFAPLGIKEVRWGHDPQGISLGPFGLFLQPRDMAKIGYLYLRNGVWEKQAGGSSNLDRSDSPRHDRYA